MDPPCASCEASRRWEKCSCLSLSVESNHLAPGRVLPSWELTVVCSSTGTIPDSLEQLHGGLSSALVKEVAVHPHTAGADSCAGLDPPFPQHTRSRLLGKMPLLFQADNSPFPCKSLHAPVLTYPQSITARQMLKGQTHRSALLSAKGKQTLLVPEGGNPLSASALLWGSSDPSRSVRRHWLQVWKWPGISQWESNGSWDHFGSAHHNGWSISDLSWASSIKDCQTISRGDKEGLHHHICF